MEKIRIVSLFTAFIILSVCISGCTSPRSGDAALAPLTSVTITNPTTITTTPTPPAEYLNITFVVGSIASPKYLKNVPAGCMAAGFVVVINNTGNDDQKFTPNSFRLNCYHPATSSYNPVTWKIPITSLPCSVINASGISDPSIACSATPIWELERTINRTYALMIIPPHPDTPVVFPAHSNTPVSLNYMIWTNASECELNVRDQSGYTAGEGYWHWLDTAWPRKF